MPPAGKPAVSERRATHRDDCLLRASGDESEILLAWGLADQLLASAGVAVAAGTSPAWTRKDADVMAIGAHMAAALGDLQAGDRVVMLVIDDLHWSDRLSGRITPGVTHCTAGRCLKELGPGGLRRAGDDLPAPRELAAVVLARLKALSGPAQGLVTAAAVLDRSCPLVAAAALAGLGDPLPALDEAVGAGLLVEDRASRPPRHGSGR